MDTLTSRAAAAWSAEEWALRRDLAACYRLVALFGWDDLVSNHISVRLPGEPEAFLLNPYGFMFEEITASSLVKVDMDGNILEDTPHVINKAGYVVHSAVHAMRPDARCVIHLHTRDGVAVSMTETGLLPLNQSALLIGGDIAFHDYEGPALRLDERERLAADLGQHNMMILRNHGTMALGASVAEAFNRLYFLEWCCTTQVRALSMGQPLRRPPAEVVEPMLKGGQGEGFRDYAVNRAWPALLRKLDRIDPSYRD